MFVVLVRRVEQFGQVVAILYQYDYKIIKIIIIMLLIIN